MKLNVKQTIKIGLGFLTTMMLWQVYNWFVPLYLNEYLEGILKLDKLVIGIIMALDNLVALFMIPLMGKLSDKTNTKLGKRMPFILVGILLSSIFFILLPYAYKTNNLVYLLLDIFMILICMNIYKSPTVSLMPDVTPKQLRNKGNSVVNILGAIGVGIGYISILLFYDKSSLNSPKNSIPFIIVGSVMLVCLLIMLLTINENKMVQEYKQLIVDNNLKEDQESVEKKIDKKTNNKKVLKDLLIVFLVYMAVNAMETWISLYTSQIYPIPAHLPLNLSIDALSVACVGIGTFIMSVPSALIADKIGRKKTISIGSIVMGLSYLAIALINIFVGYNNILILFFLLIGMGLSLISINIYPLIIEHCNYDEIGTYTSKYYVSTMLAQSITPAISGFLMSKLIFNSMKPLFIYCFVFMLLTFILSSHKD